MIIFMPFIGQLNRLLSLRIKVFAYTSIS